MFETAMNNQDLPQAIFGNRELRYFDFRRCHDIDADMGCGNV